MIMDDSAQHTREGNSLKPTKMCYLKNGLWLLKKKKKKKKRGDLLKKMSQKWSRKITTDVITLQIKGECREREIERERNRQIKDRLPLL